MRNRAILAAALLALSACSAAPPRPAGARFLRPTADPSAVIATELAFARAAREKGQWTAFRDYATGDAVWPTPQWASVQASLKGEADPAQAIAWEPDMVWSSCDGSFALSTGPSTRPDGRQGRFSTIWQRQDDGAYRWVLDQGFDADEGYAAKEMISARVADCAKKPSAFRDPRRSLPSARRGEAWQSGRSDDGSLAWQTTLAPDCRRTFVVSALQGDTMTEVFRRVSPAPRVAAGAAPPAC